MFFIPLMFLTCNKQGEIKSADQQLIERINTRLENRDFIESHSLTSPYSQISKDIKGFRKYAAMHPQYKAATNSFSLITDTNVLGMKNSNDVEFIKSSLQEYYRQINEPFNETDFYATNDRLNRYSSDDIGVNNLFEEALKEKSMSQTQGTVLKTLLSKITNAKSVTEASSINKTVEYEVINSNIGENDKALILTTNSVFNEKFENQIAHLTGSIDSYSFKKTAVVAVIILVVVVNVAVAAVVGAITGSLICCIVGNDCSWDCIGPRVRNSVLTTLARSAYGLLFR